MIITVFKTHIVLCFSGLQEKDRLVSETAFLRIFGDTVVCFEKN